MFIKNFYYILLLEKQGDNIDQRPNIHSSKLPLRGGPALLNTERVCDIMLAPNNNVRQNGPFKLEGDPKTYTCVMSISDELAIPEESGVYKGVLKIIAGPNGCKLKIIYPASRADKKY